MTVLLHQSIFVFVSISLTFCVAIVDAHYNSCLLLPQLDNGDGYYGPGGDEVGDRRTVNCYDNQVLDGPDYVICLETGLWSKPGRCKRLC